MTLGRRNRALLLIPVTVAALVLAFCVWGGSGFWQAGQTDAQKRSVFAPAQKGAAGMQPAADANDYSDEDLPPGDLDDDDPDADILQVPPPAEKP